MDQKTGLFVNTDTNANAKSITNPGFQKKTNIFVDVRWEWTLTEPFADPFSEYFAHREGILN